MQALAGIEPTVAAVPGKLQGIANAKKQSLPNKMFAGASVLKDTNKEVAIPAILALRALVEDKNKQKAISQELARLSALLAAPAIGARTADLLTRILSSSNKSKAMDKLAPASLMKSMSDLGPSFLYHLNSTI